mgnify:FL=1
MKHANRFYNAIQITKTDLDLRNEINQTFLHTILYLIENENYPDFRIITFSDYSELIYHKNEWFIFDETNFDFSKKIHDLFDGNLIKISDFFDGTAPVEPDKLLAALETFG